MKKEKILIFGMTPYIGGIENYLINILQNINHEKFDIDLLVKENIYGSNGDKIRGYYNKMYKMVSIKRHPIKFFLYLKRLSQKNQYDVVHFNYCTSVVGVYALIIKFYSKKTRIFIHSHNGNSDKKITHYLFRPLVNKIANVKIACSEKAAQWMFGKNAFKTSNIILCNNFIDTDKFLFNNTIRNKVRNKLKIHDDMFVIGHIGRFANQKNHKGLIDIFSKVAAENDNVMLILLGTGELEQQIKEYVECLGLRNRVLFLGLTLEANEYYQAMDLFILPSLFEGLPVVGIEAQASGLKCLFSKNIDFKCDISGNVEFINLNNLDVWKDKINNIIESNYTRQNMKNVLIKAGYDLHTEINKIEKMYLEGERKK